MERDKWIIESRRPDGPLDFSGLQPESVFGHGAITGLSSDAIAKVVYQHVPDAVLAGDSISRWPALLDPRWIARRKTWGN